MKSVGGRLNAQYVLIAAWICLIFFCSTGLAADWAHHVYALVFEDSGLSNDVPMIFVQKGFHVFLFGVLGWLVVAGQSIRRGPWTRAILCCFVVGAVSEALQLGFPGRGPSLLDVVLNGLSGSAVAWIALHWFCGGQANPKSAS